MYSAQQTISKVQEQIKRKNDTQKHMLEECGLSVNMLKQMTDKNGMASFSLAKIADYLDCSVDFLLGRTDNSNSHKCSEIVNSSQISGNHISNAGNISVSQSELSSFHVELIELYNKLTAIQQAKLLALVSDIVDGKTNL